LEEKMGKRIFITDLDGTLLRSDQSISELCTDILTDAMEKDVIISYATARGYISSSKVTSSVSWKFPLILYNGALIYDGVNKSVIDGYWLDNDVTEGIIEIGKKYNITPLYFALDTAGKERVLHETLVREGDLKFRSSRVDDPRFMEVGCLKCPKDYKTLALTYIGRLEEVEPVLKEVTENYGERVHSHCMKDYYIENHYFLEFSHPKANKRDGLRLWAKHMNVNTEDIVIFGDNLNDMGLFEAAGRKVAVNNAHEAIKRLADMIIESNDEDGVAKYIREQICS
jgi:Cof subfamily protein (haloacid dehalogenase superfamily)